jgi:thiamine transport system ATP-binding protein
MINLNHVTYLYDRQTMRFNLQVTAGETLAILGPSGAGKSTLLNLIAGFIFADEGSILLNGQDHTFSAPAQRPVSMLFQENNLFAHLTVAQNIGLGLDPGLRLSTEQQRLRRQIMADVGLTDLADRLPAQLSGGQRQRAALARCLVRDRPILLLDEPFSALDPALRNDMLALVESMQRERNLTLLMVSHNLDDALRIAERSLVIVDGTIRYDGAIETLTNGQNEAAQILGIISK